VSELQSVLRKQFEQFEPFESAQETQKEFVKCYFRFDAFGAGLRIVTGVSQRSGNVTG